MKIISGQCQAINRAGKPCKSKSVYAKQAEDGKFYCYYHHTDDDMTLRKSATIRNGGTRRYGRRSYRSIK